MCTTVPQIHHGTCVCLVNFIHFVCVSVCCVSVCLCLFACLFMCCLLHTGRPLTQMCVFSTVEELEASAGRVKGGSFPSAQRFPAVTAHAGSQRQTESMPHPLPSASPSGKTTTEGPVFSSTKRFQERKNLNPAPGDYKLGRLFEEAPGLSADRSNELVDKIEGERILRNQSCNFMATQVRTTHRDTL